MSIRGYLSFTNVESDETVENFWVSDIGSNQWFVCAVMCTSVDPVHPPRRPSFHL